MASRFEFSRLILFTLLLCRCNGSQKRGIAISVNHFLCDDFKAFGTINWWYDWQLNPFYLYSKVKCTGLEIYNNSHVPMVWGRKGAQHGHISTRATAVLGFNEPNHDKQSNLSGREAAKYWPEMEKLSKGLPLASPSASPCGDPKECHGNTIAWFDEFFSNCKGCRVDYLATHRYDCNAYTVMNHMKELYERYGRKIWLTEFNCFHAKTASIQLKFMKEILEKLEAADYIYRYSWFSSRTGSADSLLEPNSSKLTPLGKFYVSYKAGTIDQEQTLGRQLRNYVWKLVHKLKSLLNTIWTKD